MTSHPAVGDTHYQPSSWLEMYSAFGFGQPTGVQALDTSSGGLREDGAGGTQPTERGLRLLRDRMLACNGLALPQTTVMQVARAYAGLATGELPQLRLVHSVDGEALPSATQPLPLRESSLKRIRAALG